MRARELFSKANDVSMWAFTDEADRTYWRKLAVEQLEGTRQANEDSANGGSV